mgnify:FL=1
MTKLAQAGINSPIFRGIGKFFGVEYEGEKAKAAKGLSSSTQIAELISFIVQILLVVAGSIAVIYLIVGAYRYITAHGNEEQMESAKKTMTGAIVGLVIIALAFAVITIILNILISGPGGTGLIPSGGKK